VRIAPLGSTPVEVESCGSAGVKSYPISRGVRFRIQHWDL
jgi:hypothetical protein